MFIGDEKLEKLKKVISRKLVTSIICTIIACVFIIDQYKILSGVFYFIISTYLSFVMYYFEMALMTFFYDVKLIRNKLYSKGNSELTSKIFDNEDIHNNNVL
mgnify:CR=1 FL=1